MPEFSVKIVERPAIRAAGFKVATTMEKAGVDCPEIWSKTFAPHMESFPADPARRHESFGVSAMTSESDFDYWAVMPLAPGANVPGGMAEITIQGGVYAECPVKSLEELGAAFNHVYTTWPQSQKEYAPDFQKPCYELYTDDFMKNGNLVIYCPVVKN